MKDELKERDFYKEYFSKASSCDIKVLLALPICQKCKDNYKNEIKCFREGYLDPDIRKNGFEDKHAIYRIDFTITCSFCGSQTITQGLAMGIPDEEAMLDMLAVIIDEHYINDIRILQKCYGLLSNEYVHFSMVTCPNIEPKEQIIGNKKIVMYGIKGLLFCLEYIDHLTEYYYKYLENCKNSRFWELN